MTRPALLVAHRTPRSPAACAVLAESGARLFELDVQVGRTELIVSHYVPLFGVFERDNWRIRPRAAAARDARVTDAALAVPIGCRVLLDLKARTPQDRMRLTETLLAARLDPHRFVACGSDLEQLATLREEGLPTWRSVGGERDLAATLAGGVSGAEAVTVRHTLLTAARASELRNLGVAVVAWTVNDPRRAAQLRTWGLDGVTSDRGEVFRAWMSVRGSPE